jgi:hypothetical protein
MTWLDLAVYSQQLGSLIIAVCGLWLFRKRNVTIKVLGFYGLTSCILQLLQDLSIEFKLHIGNIIGNISTFIETLFILGFFALIFSNPTTKKIIGVFAIAYTILFLIIIPNHYNDLISSTRTIRDVLLILCSLLYFYSLLQEMPTNDITRFPPFWMVSSILFYFSCTFILSLILDYLIKVMNDDLIGYWTYRNFMRFGFCIGISYGLWLDLKTRLETARQ